MKERSKLAKETYQWYRLRRAAELANKKFKINADK